MKKVKKETVFAYAKGIGVVLLTMLIVTLSAKSYFYFIDRVEPENCDLAIKLLTAFLLIVSVLWTKHKLLKNGHIDS